MPPGLPAHRHTTLTTSCTSASPPDAHTIEDHTNLALDYSRNPRYPQATPPPASIYHARLPITRHPKQHSDSPWKGRVETAERTGENTWWEGLSGTCDGRGSLEGGQRRARV